MNNTEKVIKYYNDGQDEYMVKHIENGAVLIAKKPEGPVTCDIEEIIGFYEWLINSRYGVFDVFGLKESSAVLLLLTDEWDFKSAEEIINYLTEATNE